MIVSAGTALQPVLDSAVPGDVIELEAGATFEGQFVLPAKSGRVQLTGKGILQSSAPARPALRTAPRAHHWHLTDFFADGAGGQSDVLRLGSATQTLRDVPRRLLLERVTVRPHPTLGGSRGVQLNSADTELYHVKVARGFVLRGIESHGLTIWNSPGGITIEHCDIWAPSIGFMSGGEPPSIPDLVPTKITFRHNHVHRALDQMDDTIGLGVKNLFEVKNGEDVTVEDNVFEGNWLDGQNGYPILFTPRGGIDQQTGRTAPWARVRTVRFRNNMIVHAGGGINVLGTDTNRPSGRAEDIIIENNHFFDISRRYASPNPTTGAARTAAARFLSIVNEPHGLIVRGNFVENEGEALWVDSGRNDGVRDPVYGFEFERNHLRNGRLRGNGMGSANGTIAAYLPGAVIQGNELAGENPLSSPAGNLYPSTSEFEARWALTGAGSAAAPESD
jgi:hypothetical protein